MKKEYFYLNGETKVGPLSLDALKFAPITPTTLVWTNTIPDWVEAQTLPELEGLFNSPAGSPPSPPQASYGAGNYANPAGVRPPMPENYLVWAILTTVLCCLPLGIVSIVNATKVSTLYLQGDYTAAQKASDNAKKWALWGAILGVVIGLLYIIFIVVFGVLGGLAEL